MRLRSILASVLALTGIIAVTFSETVKAAEPDWLGEEVCYIYLDQEQFVRDTLSAAIVVPRHVDRGEHPSPQPGAHVFAKVNRTALAASDAWRPPLFAVGRSRVT